MKRLISCLCCFALCVALTACGKKDEQSAAEKTTKGTTQTTTVTESTAQTDVSQQNTDSSMVTYASVAEFFEANKEAFLVYKEAMGGTGLSLDVNARDNSLVYSYRYTQSIGDSELVKDALESGFDKIKETYKETLKELKKQVPSIESVIIEYLDMDGSLITSCEVKNEK